MDPHSTKVRVLDAAARVFLTHGLAAASMDQVRQEAGVSNGSLYHHFPTKAQLADALYAQTLRGFHTSLLLPLSPRTAAQAGVKGLVRGYVQWVLAHPTQARLLNALRKSGELAVRQQTGEANADGFGALARWVAARTAQGEMRDMPFALWMALVFSPVMALTPHWLAQEPPAVSPKARAVLEHAAWMSVAP